MNEQYRRDGATGHLNDVVLTSYLDARAGRVTALSPAVRTIAEQHLAACAACRATMRELEATVTLLRELPQLAPRRSFALLPEAGAAGGTVRQEPVAHRLRWVWPVRWASALVTLLLVLTLVLDNSDNSAVPGTLPAVASQQAPAATQTVTRPAPTAVSGTVQVVTAPSADDPREPLTIFGLTPVIVEPPATAVVVAPVTPGTPATTASASYWRAAEIALGALALALAGVGFLIPLFLRRRSAATPAA